MSIHGLLEIGDHRPLSLSRKGRLLAYNIEEFRIQVEHGKVLGVLEKLKILPGSIILDVGCGGGQTLFAVADREPSLALGMDFDRDHLEIAQALASHFPLQNGLLAFQQGDGNSLPFRDNSIDVVICRGALHYLRIGQALKEMARVLKPGGHVFIHGLGIGSFVQQTLKSNVLDRLFGLFGIFNGILYFLTGKQVTVRYRNHSVRVAFLTAKSLKTVEEMGIDVTLLERVPCKYLTGYYVFVGQKRKPELILP
jgi:ubiquinone/menaquinone biosynthesis C-methylase UbiE